MRTLQVLSGVLLAAAAVAAVVVALTASGGKAPVPVHTLLAGIPQSGTRLGASGAPVRLQYYGDLECPVCRSFSLNTLSQLIERDVRQRRLQITFHSAQSATHDAAVFRTQQVAALAAGRQDHAWDYVELFYNEQGLEGTGYVNEAFLRGIAGQIRGLDLARWQLDRGAAALASEAASDQRTALAGGFTVTPTLVISGPNGTAAPISGDPSYGAVEQAIHTVGG